MLTERRANFYQPPRPGRFQKEQLQAQIVPALSLEVASIKNKGETFLYSLPGTGFDVKKQVNLFLSNIREGKALEQSFEQIEQDIQGFKIEYLLEKGLFPIILDRQNIDGKERIVAPLYGGKIWAETVSDQERDGEIKKAITGDSDKEKMGIEQFLLSASPGSFAVLVSPPGWSGYSGISYKDTQTYIFQVQKDGRPRGFTVKTDMTVVQVGELLKNLGGGGEVLETAGLPDREKIKRIVRNYALLNSQETKLEIEDVINLIEVVKGSEVAFLDTRGVKRYFSEIISGLKNPESLWTLDEKAKSLINEFKNFALYLLVNGGLNTGENLEIALGVTILKLAETIRGKPNLKFEETLTMREMTIDYGKQLGDPGFMLSKLQKIPGCAGGGRNESAIIESITPRSGIIENDKYGSRIFECPECHKKVTRPKDQLLSKCPHCESSKVAC